MGTNTGKESLLNKIVLHYMVILAMCALLYVFIGPLLIDDSYIYFRYVENYINGYGLVYNLNDWVLGVTSYLYTFVLVILTFITKNAPVSSMVISFLSNFVILSWIFFLSRKYLGGGFSWLAVGFYILNPLVLSNSLSGMESTFMLAMLISSIGFYIKERYFIASFLAGMFAIIRPEGISFVIIYVLFRFLSRNKLSITEWISTLAPVLITLLFIFRFYGSLIPQSVIAKSLVYPKNSEAFQNFTTIIQKATDMFSIYRGEIPFSAQILFLILFLIGVRIVLNKNIAFVLLIGWVSVLGCIYAITNRFLFPWYVAPFVFVAVFVFPYSVKGLGDFIDAIIRKRKSIYVFYRYLSYVILFCLGIIQLFNSWSYITSNKFEITTREIKYKEIADFIIREYGNNQTVASVEIGSLGYFYKGKILDLVGLVSPQVTKYYKNPSYVFAYPHKIPPKLLFDEPFEVLVTYDLFLAEYYKDPKFSKRFVLVYEDTYRHHYFGKLMVYHKVY